MIRRLAVMLALVALVLGGGGMAIAAESGTGAPAPSARRTGLFRNLLSDANFVSRCLYSHSLSDDPIVSPGVPGAAHLHDFFANTTTDASSTVASMQAGATNCKRRGDTAGYWTPALYDGGQKVDPSMVLAYYLPKGKAPAGIKAFPSGLAVIAGPGPRSAQFACRTQDGRRDVAQSRTEVPACPAGSHLVVRIFFPDCWDGVNLDSADHRSHMAYSLRGSCPSTHPVPVPMLRLGLHYPGSDGGSDVTFSSGAPDTVHADFFNTWNQAALERLVRECLNADVKCAGRGPEPVSRARPAA